ncbi:MAG: four-carbon acid sugar kinase family protein [Hyphomicrobiaceae bacterium]
MNPLLMAFYGDDFTGSADAMEALTVNGVRTALFLGHPTEERLKEQLQSLQAVGISGTSRTMTPAQMDGELPDQLRLLNGLNPRLIHYKVCATFDSSPQIGSIGRAADIAFDVITPASGVIVQGIPLLGRYIAFGNHFTIYGDERFRLDRHPVMSKHPITPMDEGDIRVHFSKMSDKSVALIDLVHMEESQQAISERFDQCLAAGADIVLFDTLNDKHLFDIGQLLHEKSEKGTIFAIGSSGFEYAMARYWQAVGLVGEPPEFPPIGPVEKMIVVSGSAAANTAEQIKYALAHGFGGVALNTDRLVDKASAEEERNRATRESLAHLSEGRNPLLYATMGPDDPIIKKTVGRVRELGIDQSETGKMIATQQGLILRALLEETGIGRVCVAGGDTCSYALRQLDIHSLELLMPIAPAAPLCLASSDNPTFDGLQAASKGGQIGAPEYFHQVLGGRR